MFNNILGSEDSEQFSLFPLIVSSRRLPPDVSKIAIASPRPSRSTGVLDIQSAVQRHAVGSSQASIGGALAFIAHRRSAGLSGKQQRVHVRLARRGDAVRDEDNQQRHQPGRVGIPLAHKASDAGVEALEETHLVAREQGKTREQGKRELQESVVMLPCAPL